MVYYEEATPNFKERALQIISYIHKPINKSLIWAYLESKYEILVAHNKGSSPILQQANSAFSKLIVSHT